MRRTPHAHLHVYTRAHMLKGTYAHTISLLAPPLCAELHLATCFSVANRVRLACGRIVEEQDEHAFEFDILDATKLIPEEQVR